MLQPRLGVNIDHVATLRQARGTLYPSVLKAAEISESAGADQITVHLREDRRHIQDQDVFDLKKQIKTKLNLEMAATEEMLDIALKVKPDTVTLVPEKREELTTEGGLDVLGQKDKIKLFLNELKQNHIQASLFIDPDVTQVEASKYCETDAVEFHTGTYCELLEDSELERLFMAGNYAKKLGLDPLAGHGLHLENIEPLVKAQIFTEYNIGHSIVADAVFVGLEQAVKNMKNKITN